MTDLKGLKLHLVTSMDDANACLSWLGTVKSDRLGFDTEGTGIDTQVDTVRMIQFGDENEGWSIPYERWGGLAEEIFRKWDKRFVGWNSRFDVTMLDRAGIHVPIHRVDDGRFLAHINDPSESTALKRQAAKYIDPRAASMQSQLDEVMASSGHTWATVPIVENGPFACYWWYASLDPIITVRLWNHHAPNVLSYAAKAYDVELATGWVASTMEKRGVCVDRPYTEEKRIELLGMYDDMTARGRSEFGIDLGSAQSVIDILQHDGANLWKRTPGGAWSLDKEALKGVDHPLAHLVQERKRVEKLGSTYLRRFLEGSERDGRLHPRLNTVGGSGKSAGESGGEFGVRTGRMSQESPNLQQLPRVDKSDPLSIIVRNCIVSSPGHTFLFYDLDQIELRLLAHLSKDPGLIEALLAEDDFFMLLTRKVYQDDSILKSDPRRTPVKSYTYATNYGSGLDRLATTTGRPLAEIEKLDADFNAAYPGVKGFQRAIHNAAMQRYREEGTAYVVSPMTGRRFATRNLNKLYQLTNHIVQGWAAEIMKTLLLELDAAGLGDYLCLVVHDEAIVDVPDEMVPEAIEIMSGVMNNDKILSLPITSGGAYGKRWAEKIEL